MDATTGDNPQTFCDSGNMLGLLCEANLTSPPVMQEVAYGGPPLACRRGGPRYNFVSDPDSNSTADSGIIYEITDASSTLMASGYWDPRLISPFSVMSKAGGGKMSYSANLFLEALGSLAGTDNADNGDFSKDGVIAVRGLGWVGGGE